MSNSDKEMCYEYFDCKAIDCIRREKLDMNCWDIDDVRCCAHSEDFEKLRKILGSKLEACKLCIYYKKYNQTMFKQSYIAEICHELSRGTS